MSDRERGFYAKYSVERLDGSTAENGKHEHCLFFVLDCDHDPHAAAALHGYFQSCRKDYPHLAKDILRILQNCKFGGE